MRIAISGYGRMGQLIRSEALSRGIEVTAVIDPVSSLPEVTSKTITARSVQDADVIIDFSVPSAAVDNIYAALEAGRDIVVGTTGWYDRLEEVSEAVGDRIGLLWSGNFSLGVNLFFSLVKYASEVFDRFEEYDCLVHEYHHNQKADSPSGTAEMLGKMIVDRLGRKSRIETEAMHSRIDSEALHVSSTRGGFIPGTHTVQFDSMVDTIELTHRARNREGFASGAVRAAAWIAGRQGVYTIDDMFSELLGGR